MKSRRVLFVVIPFLFVLSLSVAVSTDAPQEAPAGFDGLTNGFSDQATHDGDRVVFAEQESIDDGLGPVYNAQSCGECHQNPITGGNSQVVEQRAGRLLDGVFFDHPGDSLIHSRAIDAAIQERILPGNPVRTFRTSLGLLGDGFVEAIADSTLQSIANGQPARSSGLVNGQVISVPVFEAPGQLRVGRFGHKGQQASLLSFAADAYLNEMGITTPFLSADNTSNGNSVAAYDNAADPEDDGEDVEIFARFMRSLKAPPRDEALAATADAQLGEQTFNAIGCDTCHVPRIVTAPAGTVVNGGTFRITRALGNKVIHPFGDFLLHDVDTGDGIVQNGGPSTMNKVRTIPLWGLRTRNRFMHDGETLTLREAIVRHGGEAALTKLNFLALSNAQRQRVLTFLLSL